MDRHTEVPIMRVTHPKEGESYHLHRDIKPNSAKPSIISFPTFGAAKTVNYSANHALLYLSSNLILRLVLFFFYIAKLYLKSKK